MYGDPGSQRILQSFEDDSDEDGSEDDSPEDIRELEARLRSMEAVLSERERGLAAREAQFALDRAELHAMRAQLLEEKQRIRDGRAGTAASTKTSAATTPAHDIGGGDAQTREFKLKGIPYVRVYGPRGQFLGAVPGNDIEKIRALLPRAAD